MSTLFNHAIEKQARERVERTPDLKEYEDIIFAPWPNWPGYMKWVLRAPVPEIVGWAQQVDAEMADELDFEIVMAILEKDLAVILS